MTKLILVSIVLAGSLAYADEADPEMQGPPTKSPVREGATVTLGVGPGEYHIVPSMGDEVRVEGPAFSIRGGAAILQTSAVEGMISFVGGNDTKSMLIGGDIKFYTSSDVYVRVGGGIATINLDNGGMPHRFWGPGGLAGVGYEWFQLRDIALFGELEGAVWKPQKSSIMGMDVDPNATVINVQLNFGICWF